MKKSLVVVLAFVLGLLVGSVGIAVADDGWQGLPLFKLIINGKEAKSVPTVQLVNDVMLPMSAVADSMGMTSKVDAGAKTVTLTSKGSSSGASGSTTTPAKPVTPTTPVYSDEKISITNLTVKANTIGMTEVTVEVQNLTTAKLSTMLTVTFYDASGSIMGTATGTVLEIPVKGSKVVQLLGIEDYTKYAKFKFQRDFTY